jgi:hypothetical protein
MSSGTARSTTLASPPRTRAELELEVNATPLDVQDALAALHGSGLVHLHGELVIASRAARRMDELKP